MKTVWCVVNIIENTPVLKGIFSTKENAIEWLRNRIEHGWTQEEINWCAIEEWYIDN